MLKVSVVHYIIVYEGELLFFVMVGVFLMGVKGFWGVFKGS